MDRQKAITWLIIGGGLAAALTVAVFSRFAGTIENSLERVVLVVIGLALGPGILGTSLYYLFDYATAAPERRADMHQHMAIFLLAIPFSAFATWVFFVK